MILDSIDTSTFSSGQIASKIWAAEILESLPETQNLGQVWILGGWYATMNFVLRTRGKMPIQSVASFDLDPDCAPIARKINKNWEIDGSFSALTIDCNQIMYQKEKCAGYGEAQFLPELIINTSCEHIDRRGWWENIPSGISVLLQTCTQKFSPHYCAVSTQEEFYNQFPFSKLYFSGKKEFIYPNSANNFTRFMMIGKKG